MADKKFDEKRLTNNLKKQKSKQGLFSVRRSLIGINLNDFVESLKKYILILKGTLICVY
jgi:hypothetical protein